MLMLTRLRIRIFRDTLISILVFVKENFVVSVKYVSLNFTYFLLLVGSLANLIAVPVVFSHSRTSLVGVFKIPRGIKH